MLRSYDCRSHISLKIVTRRRQGMEAPFGCATEPDSRRVSTRERKPNVTLDLEGIYLERLRAKKNERSGLASNVTARIKEITGLLNDDRNIQTVKEKLVHVVAAFEKFKEAHFDD